MFESIIVRAIKHNDVVWDKVKYLDILEPDNEKYTSYEIFKGAETFLHQKMGVRPGTSKEVYKKSESIWRQLKDKQLSELEENPESTQYFSLNSDKVVYLVDDYHNLIDVFEVSGQDALNEFKEQLEKYKLNITTKEKFGKFFIDGKGGMTKLVYYDTNAILPEQVYTPVVMVEYNHVKSTYKVYTGILLYETFTFIPSISSYMECKCYSDLIKSLDMATALDYSTQNAEELYETYKKFEQNGLEISARELISLLKKVGYKLELKDDDQMDKINDLLDEENNEKIQDFFNTFKFTTGESALDILSLSELKKIFRYNKLTLLDVLKIFSKEYLNYEGSKITVDILGSITYNLYLNKNDKQQAESIKNEITE